MKRKTLKFLACAAVMALTLSVTACGGSDDSNNTLNVEDTADALEDTAEPEAEVEEEEEVFEDEDVAEDETEEVPEEEEEVSEDDDIAEDETEEEGDVSEKAQTLEEFFNDPTLKDVYDRMLEAMSDDELSLSYEVSGNDFVMIFTITDSDYVTDEVADGLVEALETQGDQFKAQAAQFDSILEGNGTCTVTVRYTDPDGNVMAEKTYTAD